MNGETGKIIRLGVVLGGVAISIAACASPIANPFKPPPANPDSPVADAANRAAKEHGRYPTFADIPPVPTDVRTAAQYKDTVAAQQRVRDKVAREGAIETFTLNGTEPFADQARTRAKRPNFEIPTQEDRARTDAFAKAARDRASAPPRPQ
jgi:hypothetical protein